MHACMHTSIPMAPRERLRPLSPHDRPWSPATGAAQLGGQGLTDSVSAPRTRDRCERRWPNQTMIADERAGRPNQTMIADERAEDSRACTRKCTRIHPHSEWSFFLVFCGKTTFLSSAALAPPGETMPLDASDQSLLAEALDEVPELSPSDRTRFGNALGRLLPPCF